MIPNRTHATRRLLPGVAGTLFLLASTMAHAEGPNLLDKGVTLNIGTYIVNTDTQLRVDGETEGTTVDWEKTFGGGDVNRIRGDAQWRFANRHKLRLMAFDWSRSTSRTIDEDIIWDDEVFPADTTVSSRLEMAVYELAYEYAFLRRERFEVAASAGVHLMNFEASLAATIDDGSDDVEITSDASTDAPLPVLGLRGTWHIGGDFWLDAVGQYFALSIDDYDGNLVNYRIALTWQPLKWAGIGIGYDYFGLDVDVDSDDFQGELDWRYDGPQLFYSVSF